MFLKRAARGQVCTVFFFFVVFYWLYGKPVDEEMSSSEELSLKWSRFNFGSENVLLFVNLSKPSLSLRPLQWHRGTFNFPAQLSLFWLHQ